MPAQETELEKALKESPTGGICAGCGKENTYVDDCGFWYKNDANGDYKAHCADCMGPPSGDR